MGLSAACSVVYLFHLVDTGQQPLHSPVAIPSMYAVFQGICLLSCIGQYRNMPSEAPYERLKKDLPVDEGELPTTTHGVDESGKDLERTGSMERTDFSESREHADDPSEGEGVELLPSKAIQEGPNEACGRSGTQT